MHVAGRRPPQERLHIPEIALSRTAPEASLKAWPLRPNALPEERIHFLGTQLDALASTNGAVILDRFKLLGPKARRAAGALQGHSQCRSQCLVQAPRADSPRSAPFRNLPLCRLCRLLGVMLDSPPCPRSLPRFRPQSTDIPRNPSPKSRIDLDSGLDSGVMTRRRQCTHVTSMSDRHSESLPPPYFLTNPGPARAGIVALKTVPGS